MGESISTFDVVISLVVGCIVWGITLKVGLSALSVQAANQFSPEDTTASKLSKSAKIAGVRMSATLLGFASGVLCAWLIAG